MISCARVKAGDIVIIAMVINPILHTRNRWAKQLQHGFFPNSSKQNSSKSSQSQEKHQQLGYLIGMFHLNGGTQRVPKKSTIDVSVVWMEIFHVEIQEFQLGIEGALW